MRFTPRRSAPAAAPTARRACGRTTASRYYAAFVIDPDGNRIEAVTFPADELRSLQPAAPRSGVSSLAPVGARAAAARRRGRMSSTRSALRISTFSAGRMKPVSRMCASSASSGSQKPSMLASRIGLRVAAELLPGHLLDQFLQRADAAGQRDEGVGALEHQPLALVHVAA